MACVRTNILPKSCSPYLCPGWFSLLFSRVRRCYHCMPALNKATYTALNVRHQVWAEINGIISSVVKESYTMNKGAISGKAGWWKFRNKRPLLYCWKSILSRDRGRNRGVIVMLEWS